MPVLRIDQGTTETIKPEKLANGFLRVDAAITRTGVFVYFNPDGTKRRELRLPEEVFDAAALESFALMPLTDEHPPAMLTAENASSYMRGTVGEPKRDGELVVARLLVTDAELIEKIEAKEAREISCGYTCDLEQKPGTHPTYGAYDAIQRSIRGNHVAVVKRGRAGPAARVRMDSAAVAVLRNDTDGETQPVDSRDNPTQQPNGDDPVKLIRIDGMDLDPTSDAFAQAFARLQAKHAEELKAKNDAIEAFKVATDKLQAKFDSQADELAKAKAEAKELPAKLQAQAKARVDLEGRARKVLGPKFKLDGLDDKAVRVAVLERVSKGFKADGKSDEYLAARFDAAIESFDADGTANAAARAELEPVDGEKTDGDETETDEEIEHADSGEAFEAMVRDGQQAWQKTLKRALES
jgi:hypothetical protein